MYDEYIRQAALGEVMHNDDTGMRILRLAPEPADSRTGIFTSGIVSLGPGWKIALYFSGAEHAGENLAELLKQRPSGLAPLIQMCDALSWHTSHLPEGVERLLAHCMSHQSRRSVHDSDPYLRAKRRQPLRLSHRTATALRGTEGASVGMDALELSRHPGTTGHAVSRVISWSCGALAMPIKRASEKAKSADVFGQPQKPPKVFRAGLYARVSTNDQQTLAMQNRAMREYAARRGWVIALQVREIGSGAVKREARWGRSVTDLLATLQELEHLGVGFVSLIEALDLTTPAGRAMAGLLSISAEFEREILRERTRAGLAHARAKGKPLGRPATAAIHAAEIRKLQGDAVSKSEIARRLKIGRTSVRRILG